MSSIPNIYYIFCKVGSPFQCVKIFILNRSEHNMNQFWLRYWHCHLLIIVSHLGMPWVLVKLEQWANRNVGFILSPHEWSSCSYYYFLTLFNSITFSIFKLLFIIIIRTLYILLWQIIIVPIVNGFHSTCSLVSSKDAIIQFYGITIQELGLIK